MEELQLDHTSEQWIYLRSIWSPCYSTMDISSLVHAVYMQETYENIQILLQKIHCEEHQWNVYVYLKVIAMLTVLQGRYTKFCCC